MARHRSNYLLDQLISNQSSGAELDEFLAGLHQPDDLQAYSDALETYFNGLLNEAEHPPDPNGTVDPPVNETNS